MRQTLRIAEEIQRYCAAHPNACDSVEGIAWWVQMQRQEDMKVAVRAAVDWLVKQGVLQKHELQDGSVVFRCRQDVSRQ